MGGCDLFGGVCLIWDVHVQLGGLNFGGLCLIWAGVFNWGDACLIRDLCLIAGCLIGAIDWGRVLNCGSVCLIRELHLVGDV